MTKLFHRDAVDAETLPHPKDEMWKYTNLRKGLPKTLADIDENEVTIHVKKNEVLKKVLNFSGQDSVEHHIRLRIIVEENAELVLTEKYTGEGAYWTNMITDITLHPSARFKHIRLQEESKESLHTNIVYIQQNRKSTYSTLSINKGAKMSRHDVH
ncbi:MAG: SufD family Fe-S cluster assembly protein [Alphaproteobacteria bacterium]|nr:SufD family Fe-S cluster assembly protein [Alphaproteobacteria bacterium]